VGLLLILAALAWLGWTQRPNVVYPAALALLAAFAVVAGHGIVGLWLGLLIDERNRMSLSRFQMALWTILVLSGILAAAMWNLARGDPTPLALAVPEQLWLVMGISTTSLVGSPLIRSTKTTPPADAGPATAAARARTAGVMQRTAVAFAQQGRSADDVEVQGRIVTFRWPEDARPADLFQGEELANGAHLDLGKVQMFFFTLVLVFTYGSALAQTFASAAAETAFVPGFPALDQSVVALLAISHAGYLSNKAAPHGPSP
jgi:hypothetical protein